MAGATSAWAGTTVTLGSVTVTVPAAFVVSSSTVSNPLGPVIGYQPANGEVYSLLAHHCYGDVRPDVGSAMTFDYSVEPSSSQDALMDMTFTELSLAGADPLDIATVRELVNYPSTYDDSAVYLGEFDFLIRRHLSNVIQFLSVWNEQVEESVRGASLDNINKLFVSVVPASGSTQAAIESEIRELVRQADDSLVVVFKSAVVYATKVTIEAQIAAIHDTAVVEAQIRAILLAEYGAGSAAAKRGMVSPKVKVIHQLLKDGVVALQDDGSDFDVSLPASAPVIAPLPENWRYLANADLTVTITQASYNLNTWGR